MAPLVFLLGNSMAIGIDEFLFPGNDALGFSGATATQVAEKVKSGELPPLDDFDKIVLLMGTNEVLQGLSVSAIMKGLKSLKSLLSSRLPRKVQITVAEVPPIPCRPDLDDLIQRVNKRIKKDFSSSARIHKYFAGIYTRHLYGKKRLHFSQHGKKLLAAYLEGEFSDLPEEPSV